MKHLAKECKNTAEINRYLKSIGLADFAFDAGYFDEVNTPDFDFDSWMNEQETKGLTLQVNRWATHWDVLVTKYTKKDIDQLDC